MDRRWGQLEVSTLCPSHVQEMWLKLRKSVGFSPYFCMEMNGLSLHSLRYKSSLTTLGTSKRSETWVFTASI
ncbi:hypothetical protein EmuJ_001092200 [Echinococcus multilocularis]|uniref:Uncharacterized protein n=1 Tax=Echinococcus multilocularis TaxID=6211 RepID=A0A068YF42_ECHMU|nr:hypothetical protein EmuJ_001092200 [Echinococcus multilocularis]